MSVTSESQQQYAAASQYTLDSEKELSVGATAPLTEEQDPKEMDNLSTILDSKEYQVHQEIEKLELQVKILETRDMMLTECVAQLTNPKLLQDCKIPEALRQVIGRIRTVYVGPSPVPVESEGPSEAILAPNQAKEIVVSNDVELLKPATESNKE